MRNNERNIYLATEAYVRRVLRCMGQHEDADDPRLVDRIVSEILRLGIWRRLADCRKADEGLELGA